MNLNLEYVGTNGNSQFHLFGYKVDGEYHLSRVELINDGKNYELTIGFGDTRQKMTIDVHSKMGVDISHQIAKDV